MTAMLIPLSGDDEIDDDDGDDISHITVSVNFISQILCTAPIYTLLHSLALHCSSNGSHVIFLIALHIAIELHILLLIALYIALHTAL